MSLVYAYSNCTGQSTLTRKLHTLFRIHIDQLYLVEQCYNKSTEHWTCTFYCRGSGHGARHSRLPYPSGKGTFGLQQVRRPEEEGVEGHIPPSPNPKKLKRRRE